MVNKRLHISLGILSALKLLKVLNKRYSKVTKMLNKRLQVSLSFKEF